MLTWMVKGKRLFKPRGAAFRFGAGFLEDFLRLPIEVQRGEYGDVDSLVDTHDHVTDGINCTRIREWFVLNLTLE